MSQNSQGAFPPSRISSGDIPADTSDITDKVLADKIDSSVPLRSFEPLPIVGLGGSAGSIGALQEFFTAMAPDSGMAFVIILHLSPDRGSTLAELFQRSTTMQVVTATDGMKVEANCVYVIPPGKLLSSSDGHLRLTNLENPIGRRTAADIFFRTLADTHGPLSVAIVLSGADGDGAIGLKRIKERGGLTIAQDPDEAEHPDMPRAAIATGMVDWVLRVKEMPTRLIAYFARGKELKLPTEAGPHPAQPVAPKPDESETALRDILAYLHTRTSCDFSYYKRATILRRIARRMQVNGIDDLPGYLLHLRTHSGEAVALLQDLLIAVTNFFRDREAFDALTSVIPELFRGKGPGDTVRVWVAACATGEEAYSIAILLCEHARTLDASPQIQIFATDLDDNVIRTARDGLYPATISADVNEARLRRFFVHEENGYRVRRELREIVLFAPHDLLKDSPFSRLDLISCRNLLIYLNRDAQKRAMDVFHFALRPSGRLFLGTSETVEDGNGLFDITDKKNRLYIQRSGPRQALHLTVGVSTVTRALELQERAQNRPTVPRVTPNPEGADPMKAIADPFHGIGLSPSELHYHLIERLSAPSILVNADHDIVHVSESANRFLHYAAGEPTRNLLRAVHPSLRIELRAALYTAAQTRQPVTSLDVSFEAVEQTSAVDLLVSPVGFMGREFLLVVFTKHSAGAVTGVELRSAQLDPVAQRLEQALETTRMQLRETIEQSEASTEELKASNEELQAMNEELRSATEELETSREELNSINEELTAVNQELTTKVHELGSANSDLDNLMTATDIATVFLDRELRIMRFTPSAKELFSFISTDVGRPLADLSRTLDYPEIVTDAQQALDRLKPAEREVRAGERSFLARTLPYRTTDDHIAGVVFTFTDITTLKQGEEAAARLAAIVESSSDAIVGKDLDGIVTSWNAGAEKIFGYTAADMIGQPITRLIPPERQAEEAENLQKIRSGKTIESLDTVRVHKSGKTIPLSVTISPIKDSSGKIIGGSKIAREISEVKRAGEALRASEERLRLATDAAELGIWFWQPETDQVVWENQWPYTILDIPPEEKAINAARFSSEIVHPDDRATFERAVAETLQNDAQFYFKGRVRRPDGEERWVEFTGKRMQAHDGKPAALIGIAQNVTVREHAEAALRQNVALFSNLIEQAPMGTYVVDEQFRFQQANPQALPIFKAVQPLIGRDFNEVMEVLWGAKVGRECADIFRHTLATGERYISSRFSAMRNDIGVEQAFEWETQRVILPNGEHGVVCYFHEVTERRQFESALQLAKETAEAANRSKDRFLAVLSHELRTPLTPVLMVVSVLENDPAVRPDIREDLRMIKRNIELETKLIDDLLDLSHIANGKVVLRTEAVDLNESVRQASEMCSPQLHKHDVRLEMELPTNLGEIVADRARLQQVLWNLLQNAVKFTPAHGSVRLSTARLRSGVCEIRVQDNGIGIPPDVLPRIFAAFEQGNLHITRKFGGLGLGLAISRAIVELHGGTIRAESEGEGKGATFIIELPGHPPLVTVDAPAPAAVFSPSSTPIRLLLVEDHSDTMHTLARMLRAKGFVVLATGDVASAVATAQRELFDVLVTDIGLPDGDGYEVLQAIRAHRLVPGIVMSGYGMEEDVRRSTEAGFTEHLVKPINVPQLIDAIRRVVERRGETGI